MSGDELADGAVGVALDTNRCRAYGICVTILPEVFDVPPGSPTAVLLRDHVTADEVDDLDEAIEGCPAAAIARRARAVAS